MRCHQYVSGLLVDHPRSLPSIACGSVASWSSSQQPNSSLEWPARSWPLRDRRSFDITLLRWRGRPELVAHDSWLLGTGLSAPVAMLVTQAVATVRLAAGPSQVATRTLGGLGATMAGGYLIERELRVTLSPGGGPRGEAAGPDGCPPHGPLAPPEAPPADPASQRTAMVSSVSAGRWVSTA